MNDIRIIKEFENMVAAYAGAEYGIAVSSGTNAIFLCLQYLLQKGEICKGLHIKIPSHTYLSVPCSIKNCDLNVQFEDIKWSGNYRLEPTRIWDGTVRFTKNMYPGRDSLYCLSFQYRKHLKIGRGGMIITNDKDARRWLKMARFNGRHENTSQDKDILEFCGWNMYMMPEHAARGITLFQDLPDVNDDCGSYKDYPDLSKQNVFK